ncbi:MAG: glycosyltransferase [Treponema sp.]|jgi:hypothetical protein|nr:glycosyltransferase [Treponema sp.]
MNILFDLSAAQPIHTNDFHGGSEYCKAVFFSLCGKISSNPNRKVDVFYNHGKYLDPKIEYLCRTLKLKTFDCKSGLDINRVLQNNDYALFYSALPYSYIDIIVPERTKFVYTIHGLRSLEYPWDCFTPKYKKLNKRDILKHILYRVCPKFFVFLSKRRNRQNFSRLFLAVKNQNIITVSGHSKYSLSYFFPEFSFSKVKIFYSPQKQTMPIQCDEHGMLSFYKIEKGKYILMICGDRGEKGAYRACKAIVGLFEKKNPIMPDDLSVVVAGVTYDKYYKKLIKGLNRFIFLDYISSEHLEVLYKNAHLFLYPTMNEGFGYPPLEAMKYGTLCACSANSSITEVCSDAVFYFNPFDETEMSIRILESFDTDIAAEKRKKMEMQYKKIHARQESDLEELVRFLINRDTL